MNPTSKLVAAAAITLMTGLQACAAPLQVIQPARQRAPDELVINPRASGVSVIQVQSGSAPAPAQDPIYLVCEDDKGASNSVAIFWDADGVLTFQTGDVVKRNGRFDQVGGFATITISPAEYHIEYDNRPKNRRTITSINRVTGELQSHTTTLDGDTLRGERAVHAVCRRSNQKF